NLRGSLRTLLVIRQP
ncbi:hypothetical protein FOXB_05656, partial [Fusarium oxysporum f. sp. conglutinans Fo5176]